MSHDDVVGVIYHANFPYPTDPFYSHNVPDNQGRLGYYGVFGVPRIYVDGDQTGTSDSALLNAYNARKAIATDVSLEIDGDWDGQTRQVDVTVTASTTSALPGNYRLHIVLVENGVYYEGTNGIDWHEYTMRDMFPDFEGTAVTFSGDFPQTAQAMASFTLPAGSPPHEYIAENCQIVAFLQEQAGTRATDEIHQAEAVFVTDLGETSTPKLPARFALGTSYPNPFNPSTVIPVSVKDAGSARLEILDPRGRRVAVLHDGPLAAGPREFAWDGRDSAGRSLASGIYLARLTGPTEIHSQRLVMIK